MRKRREEIGCFHYSIFGQRDKKPGCAARSAGTSCITEAFEFLLSWKDDVLMNCLSGRRDKAFDPQAMQKVRAACAVLAEDGTYPFDLSVTDPEIYRQVSAWFTDLLRKS